MEAAVLEVILDPGAADPPDAAVDDHDLAVVDVPEPPEVPARFPAAAERADGHPRAGGSHDADLDAGGREAVVELLRAPLGIGALPVDDEPDGNASFAFAISVSANTSPTMPGRKPNWLMCTEDEAAAMSASIGG